MEQIGSSIRFMLDETQRVGLPGPQFREMSEFVVPFQKAPAFLPPQPEIMIQSQKVERREIRLVQALNYVQEHGSITNGIDRQLTGVTDRTAHRDLETLVERGRLKGMGQKAARRYILA